MIKINKIVETTCKLYDPDGNYIGKITNGLELNDVKIQIKTDKVSGYYILWKNFQIFIDKFGTLSEWPKGFYDLLDDQLDALVDWRNKE